MATFAVMNGNTVSNVITTDDKEETQASLGVILVEYTDENPASIGSFYDEANNKFVAFIPTETIRNESIGAIGLTEIPKTI